MTDTTDSLAAALDKRLDDLFDEDTLMESEDPAPPVSKSKSRTKGRESVKKNTDMRSADSDRPGGEFLHGLNALLLSMEWEISDSVMDQYLSEVRRLQKKMENDKIFMNLFRMLESVGSYLKQKKVHAHQDSLRILQETQASLGMLMDMGDSLSEKEKKISLQENYARFQSFREQITGKKSDVKMVASGNLETQIQKIVRAELEIFRKRLLDDLR